MRRSTRRSARTIIPASAASRVHGLSPFSWVEATSYGDVGGAVDSLTDLVHAGTGARANTPSHAYALAAGANRCAYPVASAAFKNQPVLTTLAASLNAYKSNAPVADWKFAHNGTGYTSYTVASTSSLVAQRVLLASRGTAGLYKAMDSAASSMSIFNDVGTRIVYATGGTVALNTAYIFKTSYVEGASPEAHDIFGSTDNTADSTAAPGTGNPFGMSLFFFPGGTPNYWSGAFACNLIFNRILNAAEDLTVRAYLSKWV